MATIVGISNGEEPNLIRTHYTDELAEAIGQKVVVAGWVHDIKDLAKMRFIWLRDRQGIAQITINKEEASSEIVEVSGRLNREDVIAVEGMVPRERIARVGPEVHPVKIEILSRALEPPPIDLSGKIGSGLDARLDWRAVDLRKRENLALFRIQAKLVEGMDEWLRGNGFIEVFTPCLIGGVSESGAEVFRIDYFGKEAFLRQDPQLHRQLLMAAGFDKIYDLGPNWRAELSHTPRHLCEHRGCAVEFSFMRDEADMMRVEEELVAASVKKVKEECRRELETLGANVEIPRTPFPELRFPKIYEILEEFGKKIPYGEEYDRESELILARYVKEKYGSDYFFVNRFPYKVKPFYVMRVDEEPMWARSVDLLGKGLELSSGGQREHRYEKIVEQIKEKGMNPEGMKWFTEFFKFGVPPHGGFCIGIERFMMQLLNLENVREATLFPRTPERLLP